METQPPEDAAAMQATVDTTVDEKVQATVQVRSHRLSHNEPDDLDDENQKDKCSKNQPAILAAIDSNKRGSGSR